MKKILLCISALLISLLVSAHEEKPKSDLIKPDTIYTELKNDIVILSSTKETNSLRSLPASVSVFSQKNLEGMQVHSLKDLNAVVPNYSIADYGSKMTAPIYIRGIGARSGFQTVSLYIDNIPYFSTNSFDVELFDIQRIELLRGTQATLYGRNAMGGIINIYTLSPLNYQGTNIKVGAGNYGHYDATVSHYRKLSKTTGISLGAYYNHDAGFFRNKYNNQKVDNIDNVGARAKFEWKPSANLSASVTTSFEFTDQGAFPYRNVANNEINYNEEGFYKRRLFTNGLALRYLGNGYEINSTTGYQYLNDEMNMDQDYTPQSYFYINQRQKENSLSQEITIKSNSDSRYQWTNGAFAFYDYLHTTPPVFMGSDAIKSYLQDKMEEGINKYIEQNPSAAIHIPDIKFVDDQIDLNGNYKRPTLGLALFHQSTVNDIFVKGLSFTAGARLDYERTKLRYNANTLANMRITTKGDTPKEFKMAADTAIIGSASKDFLVFLPKAVLKYQIDNNSYAYLSASRGYKSGGHNIQIFADILQEALSQKTRNMMPSSMSGVMPAADDSPINDRISYKPEFTWNYEIGGQQSFLDNALLINYSLFYMDVKDVQLTQFIKTGGGRRIANGGKAASKGFELGVKARPCTGVFLYANYGFSDAKLRDYETVEKGDDGAWTNVNYSNNYIPFAPRSTYSFGGNISYDVKSCSLIDKAILDVNYAGVGKIYWNEANSLSQGSYGTLNAQISFEKSIFTLEFWGKNLLDRKYDTFLFKAANGLFAQQNKPARWGTSIKIRL